MANAALPLAALGFCTWAVYLGGLASLQSDCDTQAPETNALVNGLPCSKAYRLYWFYMSWEIVVVVALAFAAVSGKLTSMRAAFVGLFSVATLLFIDASNVFLTAESFPHFESGQPEHRIRTITAGAIMTAVVNALAVVVLGMEEAPAAPAAEEKSAV